MTLLEDVVSCSEYQRYMEAEQARQELEPLVTAYQEYQQLVGDVAEGMALLRDCGEQERLDAQNFYD